MDSKHSLSVEGNLLEHPFAELVAEISHAKLTGSLRVSEQDRKSVVYFRNGKISFAVSNARSSRLFEIMLNRGRITRDDLLPVKDFANDIEFARFLENEGYVNKQELDQLFVDQIQGILIDLLSWPKGNWTFDPLARLRDGLNFDIDSNTLLCEYGRCIPINDVFMRIRNVSEKFVRSLDPHLGTALSSDEIAVLKVFTNEPQTIEDIARASAFPGPATIQSLYVLWLAGILDRRDWNPAFSEFTIGAIRGATLALVSEAKIKEPPIQKQAPAPEPEAVQHDTVEPETSDDRISLDDYLKRVENAESYYDVLGVEITAEHAQVRQAYFTLAKMFHPDHFHKEQTEIQRRVQDAFTELAKAHETLKTPESREHYNFRMRDELADKKKRQSEGTYDERSRQLQQAIDSFDRGFSLLVDDQVDAALPFLARAAHFDPKNARFHAYYGKALSVDEKQRHKAESEMQTALRLDPQNPTFRIMLAEFFIQMNLLKRAEGELNRLLAIFPSNREAQNLLASLKQ